MIDALTVLGVALVLPLALGGPVVCWAAAAIGVALALALPPGAVAALLVLPWLSAAATVAGRRLRALEPSVLPLAHAVAAGYAVVAGCALVASRAGVPVFGIGEPIVQLTAVHYTYAGSAALVLAARAFVTAPARLRTVATAGVVLTAAAPVVVALGFVTGRALPQVGGAVLMAAGVFATAALHLHAALDVGRGSPTARILLAASGLGVWAPMALAVAWAAGQHWDVPVLSIDDMARTHGAVNALGFTLAGLVGRELEARHVEAVTA